MAQEDPVEIVVVVWGGRVISIGVALSNSIDLKVL